MNNYCINILLACYNGEKFITEQINSILNQTYKNWQLYIRDDGSSDTTLTIVKEYQKSDARIILMDDDFGNLGSCQNFSVLINSIKNTHEYTMFCDQDDVWLPNKIKDTLNEMMQAEKINSAGVPLLVYTNFKYVDEQLNIVQSKKKFAATKIKKLSFANMLAQNPVYGCTMMINNKLLEKARDIPLTAENHDFWIALVASAFGKIYYLNQQTILYRQHAKNVSGHHSNNSFTKRLVRNFIKKDIYKDVSNKLEMAKSFKQRFYTTLTINQRSILDNFIALSNKKNLAIIIRNIRNGVRRQTILQTFLFYAAIISNHQPSGKVI